MSTIENHTLMHNTPPTLSLPRKGGGDFYRSALRRREKMGFPLPLGEGDRGRGAVSQFNYFR